MCIAILSTAHPTYKLIITSNRDEYLNRPTAPATWWPDNSYVLAGRDLLRPAHGTWLGITRGGKIAVLTNFREETPPSPDAVSRGAIIRKWLSEDVGSTEQFVREIVHTGIARDAGGFSLVCGVVGEKLAVISNRARISEEVPWIVGDVVQTVGLSNAAFGDRSWKKVTEGEELVLDAIRRNISEEGGEDGLIASLLGVLSVDTLKKFDEGNEVPYVTFVKELRNTIFVPALGRKEGNELRGDEYAAARKEEKAEVMDELIHQGQPLGVSGLYGTQKQTVILVDHDNNVRFFERTLYDDAPQPIEAGKGDVDVKFQIDG